MMKIYFKWIMLFVLPVVSYGQQVTFYSNVNLLPSLYNPSVVGTDGLWSVNLLRRAQWVVFEGSPVNNNLLLEKNIADKHGMGVNVTHEKRGITSSLNFRGLYAHHLKINEDSYLDAGLSLAYVSQSIKLQSESVVEDVNDPIVNGGDISSGSFDASFGLNYRRKNLKIGIAIPQIVGQKNSNVYYQFERAYFAHASNKFKLTYKFDLEPFCIVRLAPNTPLQYDIKARAIYVDYWWIGTGYRSDYAINLDFGFNAKHFYFGYSYDIPLKSFTNYGQSHEIVVGYKKKPKKKIEYNDI